VAIPPDAIRLMDLFIQNPKVQQIREDGVKCKAAWAGVCKQAGLPVYDYADTLHAWHRAQGGTKGTFQVSTPTADGMVTLTVPSEGQAVTYGLHVRTLLLQALTAYAKQYTDPVRFLSAAGEIAKSVAARVLSPPEPR
jgi:hypothetical protein